MFDLITYDTQKASGGTFRKAATATTVLLLLQFMPDPVVAGPVAPASEFTQLMNNAELITLVAKEAEGVALNSQQLLTQIEQLRTQFLSYQNLLQNTLGLTDTQWADVANSITELRGVMSDAGALAGQGQQLESFLASNLIGDPLFEQSGLSNQIFEDRYDAWQDRTDTALHSALRTARLTLEDVAKEADLLDVIQGQGKSASGQMQAIQVGNELTASVARQIGKLSTITAAQSEQTSLFQARWLAQMDAEEAGRRETVQNSENILNQAGSEDAQELIGFFSK